ncbi:hypothetical protein LTS08_006502 [Lithohypha guttulata]|nr:hypothetical protein LTS08_006502 [Lithohypha guttulata]
MSHLAQVSASLIRPHHIPSAAEDSHQSPLQNPRVHFRDATESDIDDITTLILDAFGPNEERQYIQPQRKLYPHYEWHCTREIIREQWSQSSWNGTFAKVVAVSDHSTDVEKDGRKRDERVVALGIWNIYHGDGKVTSTILDRKGLTPFSSLVNSNPTTSSIQFHDNDDDKPPFNCSLNLAMNTTREEDFFRQWNEAKHKHIDEAYEKQLYLNVLCTHPQWDGHGFAAMNLDWGTSLARSLDLPVTLIATPAGYPLYDSYGFESVSNVSISKLDGLGSLWYEVMKYSS